MSMFGEVAIRKTDHAWQVQIQARATDWGKDQIVLFSWRDADTLIVEEWIKLNAQGRPRIETDFGWINIYFDNEDDATLCYLAFK